MIDEGQGSRHRVELAGEYDLSRSAELSSIFGALSADGPAVIDMTNVTFVDSSFLYALVTLHSRFEAWGVTLTGVQPPIRRILQRVAFQELFRISD